MNAYIYLRALKHAEHTVFCVEKGQKTYYDPQFNRWLAYSSGQQVKRSILDALTSNLNVQMAPITFNYEIVTKNGKKELQQKEVWSPCNPVFVDQLIGGWMRAKDKDSSEEKESVLKRRSPLSISAMRGLHPLLAGVDYENMTFDRSSNPNNNPVKVRMGDKLLSDEEIEEFLDTNNRTLTRRNWIANKNDSRGFGRAGGLFVYDIAIDLRTLFSVSTNQHEPELSKDKIEDLKAKGWIESENVFGKCLVLPKEEREKVIPALASALLNWRITSNQARTFSLMETLAVAISDNANKLAGAIRAKLIEDGEKPKAKPIIDETAGADVFVTLPCSNYVVTVNESADALDKAEQKLIELMMAFDYENQIV
ncbi:MAG: CRISPR-associated protein Cas7 [Bacteroidetes bacterium HGW-Bacteroidetes-1]|jgi:hypothetical protein|nr:MAG: CRISPR-associated protein Cas7 [Bacteroidetes bacterium HGW-Bacteroidetes-1]